jgi:hypothetical protein
MSERVDAHGDAFWRAELPLILAWAFGRRCSHGCIARAAGRGAARSSRSRRRCVPQSDVLCPQTASASELTAVNFAPPVRPDTCEMAADAACSTRN